MSQGTVAETSRLSQDGERPARVGQELIAGASAALVALPTCLTSGLLAFAIFGPEIAPRGAAAGLLGAAAGGLVAALAAPSSFMVSLPRASGALVLGSLAATLVGLRPFAGNFTLDALAMALAVLLAGLWQGLFGLLGAGRIIKFTPHPVLAGFVNGVALLIALSAWRILARGAATSAAELCMLGFALLLTATILLLDRRRMRVPSVIVGFAVGTAAFYALRGLAPDLPLGPTVGRLTIDMDAVLRAGTSMGLGEIYAAIGAGAPHILVTSLVIAVIVSLESLLAARAARNLAPVQGGPARFLVAQGIGNAAAAALGGLPISIGPSQTITGFRAGGRTRLTGASAALLLLLSGLFMPLLLGGIPLVVLCAILFANSVAVFDRWSVRLLRDLLARRAGKDRGSVWKNLAVVAVVMAVTAMSSVTAGVLTGIVLSGIIFIIDMSRPLVRRRYRADAAFSLRVRPERDAEILRSSGDRRVILELEGVMFFGNADDLCGEIEQLFGTADMILLDLRNVAEVDVSATGALEQAVAKAAARKKRLLFCSVPASHVELFETFAASSGRKGTVFTDRDGALEWMEETVLREQGRSQFEELPLGQIEFLRGLDARDIAIMEGYMMPMSFPAGAILCREGEEADYLWVLSSGSVSVWLGMEEGRGGRRVGALARGTIVGEISLLASGNRSATVIADEDVTGYMIDRETFDQVLAEHPRIATTLLANIAREMALRLRRTSRAFGEALSH